MQFEDEELRLLDWVLFPLNCCNISGSLLFQVKLDVSHCVSHIETCLIIAYLISTICLCLTHKICSLWVLTHFPDGILHCTSSLRLKLLEWQAERARWCFCKTAKMWAISLVRVVCPCCFSYFCLEHGSDAADQQLSCEDKGWVKRLEDPESLTASKMQYSL